MSAPLNLPSSVSQDDRDLINHLLHDLDEKKDRNQLREVYYNGKKVLNKVSAGIIPPQYYKLGLLLGWPALPVDMLAERCGLLGMVWDADLSSLGYDEVWEDNMLSQEFGSGITSGLIQGTSYLVNIAGDESAGEPKSQVHALDALSAIGDWDNRTRRLKNLLCVNTWERGRPVDWSLFLPGRTLTGTLDHGLWVLNDPHGVPTGWKELLAEPLPYKWRVRRPFGQSRITRPIMGISDAAVRALIRMEGHLDVYSYPELWMLGADESIFRNEDGSRKSVMEVRLGRIKGIPDDEDASQPRADVKQFPASDPTPHLAGLNAYAKMFAREAGLPDSAVAITDVANPTSAEAYDSAQYALISKAERATEFWTPAVKRTVRRALAIQNGMSGVPVEWRGIECQWRDPRFLSLAAKADAGLKMVTAIPGLASTSVGLELLGLTPDQIKRATAELRRAQGRQLLADIGVGQVSEPAGQNPLQ